MNDLFLRTTEDGRRMTDDERKVMDDRSAR